MEITKFWKESAAVENKFVCFFFFLEKSFKGDYIGGSSEFRMDVCVCKESPCSKT